LKLEDLARGIPPSRPLYWQDSYMHKFQGSLLRVEPDEKKYVYIVLDGTIFHPKVGGQPSDRGLLYGSDFNVEVRKAIDYEGVIIHWGKILAGTPHTGIVNGEIDWAWRYLLMRRHTAGHLFDHCLTVSMGKSVETGGSWVGDPCYIEYKGLKSSQYVLKSAETLEQQLMEKGAAVKAETVSREELLKRTPEAPNLFRLPVLETYRIVTINGCSPIPCSGTHVRDLREIGSFHVKEISESEFGYKVYYDVADSMKKP